MLNFDRRGASFSGVRVLLVHYEACILYTMSLLLCPVVGDGGSKGCGALCDHKFDFF